MKYFKRGRIENISTGYRQQHLKLIVAAVAITLAEVVGNENVGNENIARNLFQRNMSTFLLISL